MIIPWIAGGAAALYALNYFLRLDKASGTVQTETRVQVHGVTLSGITLKVYVTIKNPNDIVLKMRRPYVTIGYNGEVLGSSLLFEGSGSPQDIIKIGKQGQTPFTLDMNFGWFTLIRVIGVDIVEKIRNKDGKNATLDISAKVSTKVNGFPYEDEKKITLRFL